MKEEERLRRGAELLEWIKSEGGDVDSVRIARGPGGVGVFCARDVPRGVPFFQCPVRCVMRASDVKGARRGDADDAAFVAALDALVVDDEPIDDRVRLQLHLLNERARGSRSRYAPYIRSLPGRELVGNLPVSWACEEDPDELLCGLFDTHMFRKAHEDKSWLNKLSGALLEDPRNFPADAFGPDLLLWAHAIYWSRAIRLKLPGGGFSSASKYARHGNLSPFGRTSHEANLLYVRSASRRSAGERCDFAMDVSIATTSSAAVSAAFASAYSPPTSASIAATCARYFSRVSTRSFSSER